MTPRRQIRALHGGGTISDVTPLAHRVGALVRAGDLDGASALLPVERPYPLPATVAARVEADG